MMVVFLFIKWGAGAPFFLVARTGLLGGDIILEGILIGDGALFGRGYLLLICQDLLAAFSGGHPN